VFKEQFEVLHYFSSWVSETKWKVGELRKMDRLSTCFGIGRMIGKNPGKKAFSPLLNYVAHA
jgi:hypothetical protein